MGDLDELRTVFNDTWDWSTRGEEWSSSWGGTPVLWHGVLLPRLHAHLPAATVLEIAPGHGRFTHYLKDLAGRLVVVDLAERCIEHCRQRFADSTNLEYHVNDGRSLDMVADGSVDLVFSWDSLVHADADIVEAYVSQLSRVLAADGVAWLHHSNVGHHARAHRLAMRTPYRALRALVDRGVLLDVFAWRDPSVSAEGVAAMAERHGLVCRSQELFTWEHGRYLTEAVSVLTRPGSRWARSRQVVRNPGFRRDVHALAALYGEGGGPGGVSA